MTYQPALCMRLRVLHTASARLYVIMAADGTPLDAMEETPGTLPRWVTNLAQTPIVDVTPAIYRQFKRNYAAVKP